MKLVLEGWRQEKEARRLLEEAILKILIMDEIGFVTVELGKKSRGKDFQIQILHDLPVQQKYRALSSRWIKCSILNVVLKECFKYIPRIIILIVVLALITTITNTYWAISV